MLELFAAQSLVVASVVDETLQIYGLLVFVQQSARPVPPAGTQQLLKTVLSMFGRYMGCGVYQNKLTFCQKFAGKHLDNTEYRVFMSTTYDILYPQPVY